RILLEVAYEAIEDAGISTGQLAGSRCGVYIGIATHDYDKLGVGIEASAYSVTGNAASIAANRLSYFLDLRGPSLAIDTACSSSLVAVHYAASALRSGQCDLALVGGVNLLLDPHLTRCLRAAQMIAPSGRCRSFDTGADGYVRGEGCGVVLLRR